jgi:hypothetical protein
MSNTIMDGVCFVVCLSLLVEGKGTMFVYSAQWADLWISVELTSKMPKHLQPSSLRKKRAIQQYSRLSRQTLD